MMTKDHLPSHRSRRHRSRGQALVEFALVLPVFLLVLSGILDFGFALYSRISIINAAREGARVAAIAPAPHSQGAFANIAVPAAQAAVSGSGLSAGSATYTVSCVSSTGSSISCGNVTALSDSVKLTINYTYHSFFPLLFGSTFPLTSAVQMVVEN